jgi:hypothetical protein
MLEIKTRTDLEQLLSARPEKHYVYVLRYPDRVPSFGGVGTPFYVGIGQRFRLFEHEQAAIFGDDSSEKAQAIRKIYDAGKKPVRTIDSFHDAEPWIREAELIHEIGRKADGTGPLLNAQTYAPSAKIDGVEVRKYAAEQAAAGSFDALPEKFRLRRTRLVVGPETPKTRTSVMGKVYTAVEANPGITGEELVRLLQREDFTDNKSAYTQSGQVCAAWLVGYIDGACFHPRARIIQPIGESK